MAVPSARPTKPFSQIGVATSRSANFSEMPRVAPAVPPRRRCTSSPSTKMPSSRIMLRSMTPEITSTNFISCSAEGAKSAASRIGCPATSERLPRNCLLDLSRIGPQRRGNAASIGALLLLGNRADRGVDEAARAVSHVLDLVLRYDAEPTSFSGNVLRGSRFSQSCSSRLSRYPKALPAAWPC